MWLINSSIGRKVVMSVTGVALVLFLTFHASMNVVALISFKGYNWICEMLGANWYAVAGTVGLAALVALHFIYAIWLTLQNKKARGTDSYKVTDKPKKVEWASQYMFVLGFIVIVGICLHLYNFWYNMMAVDLHLSAGNGIDPANGVGQIANVFSCPVYTVIYLVWLCALWFHLTHGIWSSMQTLGWSGKVWFCRWRVIGYIWATIVCLMFALVALTYAFCPCCQAAGSGECEEVEAVECVEEVEETCSAQKMECQGACEEQEECQGACQECKCDCACNCEKNSCNGECVEGCDCPCTTGENCCKK